jgi:hypothetical protein
MTQLILVAAISEKLCNAKDSVEICNQAGQVLGVFYQTTPGSPPAGWRSRFTDEQIQKFRKQKTSRSLAEILKDLEPR